MEDEIQNIYKQCVIIRKSILKIKEKTLLFKNFPIGCCRDSSLVIGEILTERGFENIYYCHYEVENDSKSHAWLEYKNYIIDITAKQFGKEFEEVIVKSNKKRYSIHTNGKVENYSLQIAGSEIMNLKSDFELIKENT